MTDDMGYDLAKKLRESAKATFYDPLKSDLNRAASRIEKLEAALREIEECAMSGSFFEEIARKAPNAE